MILINSIYVDMQILWWELLLIQKFYFLLKIKYLFVSNIRSSISTLNDNDRSGMTKL